MSRILSPFVPTAILRQDVPMSQFVLPFFEDGKVRPTHPRKRITREFEDFHLPTRLDFGDTIPLIYISCGYCTFGVTRWECNESSFHPFKRAEGRTLGCPALIPCSSILLLSHSDDPDVNAIEIRSCSDERLFVAGMAVADPVGRAMRVTPLIGRAGAEVSMYFDWQPVLIRIAPGPCDQNFSFVCRNDGVRLQTLRDAVELSVRCISHQFAPKTDRSYGTETMTA